MALAEVIAKSLASEGKKFATLSSFALSLKRHSGAIRTHPQFG
jgi:hypothetical protein